MRRRVAEPTVLRASAAATDAVAALAARPGRAFLACAGMLLGVAWFVAGLGLVSTAAGQVQTVLAKRLPTLVRVTPARTGLLAEPDPYPADAQSRLEALHGVAAAGVFWRLRLGRPVIVTTVRAAPGLPGQGGPGVLAFSPGYLAVSGARVSQGRIPPPWAPGAAPACLLGAAAARSLGITGLGREPAVSIDGTRLLVAGIIDRSPRQPAVLRSVLVPARTVTALWGPPDLAAGALPTALVLTSPGAAGVVARQAPLALSPARPGQFAARVVPGQVLPRRQVNGTLTELFRVLGWLSLGTGLASIAVVSWIWAVRRGPEYALRRAVGARRRHVVAHVLAESLIIGILGALAGTSLGLAIVVLVARARGWTPVVAPLTWWPAPAAGAATAGLAAIVATCRAALAQPARTLHRG